MTQVLNFGLTSPLDVQIEGADFNRSYEYALKMRDAMGIRLSAPVSRMSGELDPKTRTLLTELDLDNTKGPIIAGSFVQVSLALRTVPYVEVPADAILPKGDKTFVAVIADGNKVNFRQIVVAESDGKSVKIQSGLNEGEVLVLNPGFGIAEGAQVQPVHVTKK